MIVLINFVVLFGDDMEAGSDFHRLTCQLLQQYTRYKAIRTPCVCTRAPRWMFLFAADVPMCLLLLLLLPLLLLRGEGVETVLAVVDIFECSVSTVA